jgi:hypothetical protein
MDLSHHYKKIIVLIDLMRRLYKIYKEIWNYNKEDLNKKIKIIKAELIHYVYKYKSSYLLWKDYREQLIIKIKRYLYINLNLKLIRNH